MRISDHYDNKFMRAADLDRDGFNVTIQFAEIERVGKDEKVTLRFSDNDDILPLNKTNAMFIADLYGDDTDDWEGKQIRVYRDKTMFAGKRVDCIRVAEPLTDGPGAEKSSDSSTSEKADDGNGSGSNRTSRNSGRGKRKPSEDDKIPF